jgi:hypothetical protein
VTAIAKRLDSLAEMLERISNNPDKEFLCSIAEELRGMAFDLEQDKKDILQ